MRLLFGLFRFCVVLTCLYAFVIAAYGLLEDTPQADLIVVLGNQVFKDGTLSPPLAARMDRAIALYEEGKGNTLFVTGAVGVEGVDEAVAMRAYAIKKGVPEKAIIVDSQGVNTHASAVNVAAYLKSNRLKSVIMVSQYFHLARTNFAFKSAGIEWRGRAFARYVEWRDAYSLAREMVGLPVYWLRSMNVKI